MELVLHTGRFALPAESAFTVWATSEHFSLSCLTSAVLTGIPNVNFYELTFAFTGMLIVHS